MVEVKRAIVIGLGRDGSAVAQQLSGRIRARHAGSVAWVQTINLTFDGELQGQDSQEEHVTSLSLKPRGIDSSEERPPWLPEGAETSDEPTRAMGRLLLHQNASALRALLRDAKDRISSKRNAGPLNQRGLQESDPARTHIMFALNLADPLASGMLFDFAYLSRAAVSGSQCWAVLLMPDLASYPQQTSDSPGTPTKLELLNMEALASARAYATLKELDYYMDTLASDIYRSRYSGRGGIGTIEGIRQVPFEHVYLVGKRNRASLSLSGAHDAAAMVGEWVYQVLFTPIGTRLITGTSNDTFEGKVSNYSSLGLSYAYFPGEELLSYVSNRLALDLISERLLNDPTPDGSLAPSNLTAAFRTQNTLDLAELKNSLMTLDGEWLNSES